MESTAAIILIGRTQARGPLTGLGAAPFTRPVRPKTPFDTGGYVVFN